MDLGYGSFKMAEGDIDKKTDYPKHISKKISKYHQSEIYAICCNLNGSLMATCSGDKSIKFYDPFNQESRGSINSENKIYTSLSFSNLNDYLLTGTSEKTVELYNYSINKFKCTLTGHSSKINAVSFTNDREKCASSSDDRTIKIWDLEKGFCTNTINCLSSCQTMDYFNYEPTIVTGHRDGSMRLFSTKDGKMLDNIKNLFDGPLSCVRLSSNNNYIITSSTDGSCLKCYDNRMKKILISLMDESYMNSHEYNKVCFGPDDRYIFGGNLSGNVLVWSLDNGTKKDVLKTDSQGLVIACEYNVIAGNLYTGDSRGCLTIWH
jgi:autophagy-related protein 16